MRVVNPIAFGSISVGGSYSQKYLANPLKYTILNSVRATTDNPLIRCTPTGSSSNTGTLVGDNTAPTWGGQASHNRILAGSAGGYWGMALPTPWDLTNSYVRLTARISNYNYSRALFICLARNKADLIAGNYIRVKCATSAAAGALGAWFPLNTWIRDGYDVSQYAVVGTGLPSITNVGFIAVVVQDLSTSNTTIYDIAQFEQIQKVGTKAKIVIWHDDSVPEGAAGMRSKMDAYGFPGTEATEWEQVNNLTNQYGAMDVPSMKASGWTFASHATTSPEHTAVTQENMANQAYRNKVQSSRRWNVPTQGADLAYWGGLDAATGVAVARQFYRSGRWFTLGQLNPELQPPAEPYMTKCYGAADQETFNTNWLPAIQTAIAIKGIFQICFHQQISTGFTGVNVDEFNKLLVWLDQNRASIDVVTLSQALAASMATP